MKTWERIWDGDGHVPVSLPKGVSKRWSDNFRAANDNFRFREPYLPSRLKRAILRTAFAFVKPVQPKGQTTVSVGVLTAQWKRLFEYLVDRRYVDHVTLSYPAVQEPPLYYFFGFHAFRDRDSDGNPPAVPGIARGFSLDYDTAVSTCIGECLERVPFLYYHNTDSVVGSMQELKTKSLPLAEVDDINAFSDAQRTARTSLGRISDRVPFRWIWGKKMSSPPEEQEVLIPSQLVYWRYKRMKGEPLLRARGTHGGAGYFTKEGALLRALYECVQRDGFFWHWLTGSAPEQIDPASMRSGKTRDLIDVIQQFDFKIHLLNITPLDIPIPSVFCVLTSRTSPHASICCGSGSSITLEEAIHSALEEALSMHHWLSHYRTEYELPENYEPLKTPLQDAERLSWWASQLPEAIDFFLSGETKSYDTMLAVFSDLSESAESEILAHVVRLIRESGKEIYYVESADQILADLGFHSVKVFVTKLLPMYHDTRNVPLALLEKRFESSKGSMRNTLPHPFP